MLRFYKFAAFNRQTVFGFGTAHCADRYAAILNEGFLVGTYSVDPVSDADAEALRLEDRTDVLNLDDELAALEGKR